MDMNLVTYRVSVLSKLNSINKDYSIDCVSIDEAIKFGKEEVKSFQLSGHVLIGTSIDFTIKSSLGVVYDSSGKQISGHKFVDVSERPIEKITAKAISDDATIAVTHARGLGLSDEEIKAIGGVGMSFRVELSSQDLEMIQNAKHIRSIYGYSQVKTNAMLKKKIEAIEKEHGLDAAIEAGEHIDFTSSGLWFFMEGLYARANKRNAQVEVNNEPIQMLDPIKQ